MRTRAMQNWLPGGRRLYAIATLRRRTLGHPWKSTSAFGSDNFASASSSAHTDHRTFPGQERAERYAARRYPAGHSQLNGAGSIFWGSRRSDGRERNFSRMAAVCEFGDRRPSSQLRSDGKVA